MKAQKVLWLVEDSLEDFEMFEAIVHQINFQAKIIRFESGSEVFEALESFSMQGRHKIHGFPSLIVLDLNLPGLDGKDILRKLKKEGRWQFLPVVIFSTSTRPQDIEICYALGASVYPVKPMGLDLLEKTLRSLSNLWFEYAVLPKGR